MPRFPIAKFEYGFWGAFGFSNTGEIELGPQGSAFVKNARTRAKETVDWKMVFMSRSIGLRLFKYTPIRER